MHMHMRFAPFSGGRGWRGTGMGMGRGAAFARLGSRDFGQARRACLGDAWPPASAGVYCSPLPCSNPASTVATPCHGHGHTAAAPAAATAAAARCQQGYGWLSLAGKVPGSGTHIIKTWKPLGGWLGGCVRRVLRC